MFQDAVFVQIGSEGHRNHQPLSRLSLLDGPCGVALYPCDLSSAHVAIGTVLASVAVRRKLAQPLLNEHLRARQLRVGAPGTRQAMQDALARVERSEISRESL